MCTAPITNDWGCRLWGTAGLGQRQVATHLPTACDYPVDAELRFEYPQPKNAVLVDIQIAVDGNPKYLVEEVLSLQYHNQAPQELENIGNSPASVIVPNGYGRNPHHVLTHTPV